jgi:predicted ABC-type ATPase
MTKEIVVLGGPNGAGKTTTARVLLKEFFQLNEFLNADEIAREIAPDDPEAVAMAAGRRMIERMREQVRSTRSFGFETTCSGKSHVRLLEECKKDGWRITLLFLWLASPELAVARVASRVRHGGHGIPENVIRRRFYAGAANLLSFYLPLADEAEIYDNSERQRVLIAEKREGQPLFINDSERWAQFEETAR